MMDKILERALQVQEWGTPPILDAGLVVAAADPVHGARLAAFLRERPPAQVKPSIVPKIGDQPWAEDVFSTWYAADVSAPVKERHHEDAKEPWAPLVLAGGLGQAYHSYRRGFRPSRRPSMMALTMGRATAIKSNRSTRSRCPSSTVAASADRTVPRGAHELGAFRAHGRAR